jgi:hypothetical protein
MMYPIDSTDAVMWTGSACDALPEPQRNHRYRQTQAEVAAMLRLQQEPEDESTTLPPPKEIAFKT